MSDQIVEVTDATFHRVVLESPTPVLVDFWAPWCGPCRGLAPILEEVAAEVAGQCKVVKLNVDQNSATSQQFRIQGIPALFFFSGGKKVGELVGAHPKASILQKIRQVTQLASGQGSTGPSTRGTGSRDGSQVVTCPSCGQKNRTPVDRLQQAVCGRCGASLASAAGQVYAGKV